MSSNDRPDARRVVLAKKTGRVALRIALSNLGLFLLCAAIGVFLAWLTVKL